MTEFMVSATSIVRNDDGEVLMVKEGKEHVRGLWDLPGGNMEEGETIEEAVKREVREETGFEVKIGKLVGLYFGASQRTGQPSIDFLVESRITGKGEKDQDFEGEILEEKFFDPGELKNLDLRKDNREKMIEDFREGCEMDIGRIDYRQSQKSGD